MRRLAIILGVIFVLFGGLCLNYTKASGREHHGEWAREKGVPEPSEPIMWAGGVAIAIGAFVAGAASTRRGRVVARRI